MPYGDIAEGSGGSLDDLQQVRRLTMDKLSPKLDLSETRIAVGMDAATDAFARFQQRYLETGCGEIPRGGQAGGAGADYQN